MVAKLGEDVPDWRGTKLKLAEKRHRRRRDADA